MARNLISVNWVVMPLVNLRHSNLDAWAIVCLALICTSDLYLRKLEVETKAAALLRAL